MTPDIGFYIHRFDLSTFAHTLPGSFLACLPTGVVLLFFYYLFCRPVCYALPSPHRQALLPLCPDFPTGLIRWGIILLSILLGAWTHNFWDAFTHEHGWFVDRIPWLQQPVLQIGSTTVCMFLLLQELSTLVGFAIVVLTYWLWLRRQQVSSSSRPGFRPLALSVLARHPDAVACYFASCCGLLRDVGFASRCSLRSVHPLSHGNLLASYRGPLGPRGHEHYLCAARPSDFPKS